MTTNEMNADWIVTLLLWFFLGCLGVRRFYHGKVGTGILMILTLGGLGIWWLVDGILIVMSKFEDSKGNVVSAKAGV